MNEPRNRDYDIFFFQAEDGIRDKLVTGVQTCALPIFEQAVRAVCDLPLGATQVVRPAAIANLLGDLWLGAHPPAFDRALALQIGRASCRKECRSRWSPCH